MKQKKRKIKVTTWPLDLVLIAQSLRNTIKGKGYSSIKCNSKSQQSNLHNSQKIKYGFYEGYDSDV